MSFKLSDMNLNRTVYLFDQFWQETAEDLITQLLDLDSQSNDDIYLVINSYGGAVYALLSIIDTVENLKSKINTVCLGIAASCGAVLFSLGNKRYIGENSKLMIHEVSTIMWGKTKDLENEMQEVRDLNNKLFTMLLNRSNLSEERMREVFEKDSYLDAKTALEYGLVDEIIDEPEEDEDKNIYYDNSIKDFVNSFKGTSRDGAIAMAMANKPLNSRSLLNQVKASISNNKKKGEKAMGLNELKNELKEKHNIDIDAQISEISNLKTSIADRDAKIATLEQEKEDLENAYANEKIEELLNSLIEDKKSTQKLNEGYRIMFSNMKFEDAKEFCANLQSIVKTTQESNSANDNEDDGDDTDKEKEKAEIKALAEEKSLSFSDAAVAYYREKNKN